MYCISIATIDLESAIQQIKGYEMAEIRLDLCQFSQHAIKKLCSIHSGLIFTFRAGSGISDKKRLEDLIFAISNGAAYIDLDIRNNPSLIQSIKEKLRETDKTQLIMSFHDYNVTPTNKEIFDHILKMVELEADLMKIVCTSHGERDNERILSFNSSFNNMVAFNMGEKGQITRALCLGRGAPFSYVCTADQKTAEGQLTKSEIERILSKIS